MQTSTSAGTPPDPLRRTWIDLADRALGDARFRRDVLIALGMVLAAVVASVWLLAGTSALLTLAGTTGVGAGVTAYRRHRRQRPRARLTA